MPWKEADPEESIAGRDEVQSGIPFFTPKAGERNKFHTTRLRILPPRDDHPSGKFYHWVAVHGQVGASNRPLLCPKRMHDEPCPVCVESQKFRQQGLEDDAIELSPKWRGMVNVIQLNPDGSLPDDPQVMVWGIPKSLLEDLLAEVEELPKRERNITSPKSGRDVLLARKGSKKKTRYKIELADEASELDEDVVALLDDGLHELTRIYPRLEFAKIAGLLAGGAHEDPFGDVPALPPGKDEDEDDDEDEDEPKKKKLKDKPARDSKSATAAARQRLRKSLQKKLAAKGEDDEEDEEDEDEEDED